MQNANRTSSTDIALFLPIKGSSFPQYEKEWGAGTAQASWILINKNCPTVNGLLKQKLSSLKMRILIFLYDTTETVSVQTINADGTLTPRGLETK
jgi:hypothetical protein